MDSLPRRIFLDWKNPCLPQVVDLLVERYGTKTALDLSTVMLATPGSRAGRRLVELLVDRCDQDQTALFPPEMITVGQIADLLAPPELPPVSPFESTLAWAEALRKIDQTELTILTAHIPEPTDTSGWNRIGREIDSLYRTLSAGGVGFGDVRAKTGTGDLLIDERWAVLSTVYERYSEVLVLIGRSDIHANRLLAAQAGIVGFDSELYLIAAPDLNPITKRLISAVSERVTVVVHAPESEADHFDQFGAVVYGQWQRRPLSIADERILIAENFSGQAEEAVKALVGLAGRYAAEEITVGIADPKVTPFLEQALGSEKIATRVAAGTPLANFGPLQVLQLLGGFASSAHYRDLASLMRHPDIADWLAQTFKDRGAELRQAEILRDLDRYHTEHLPARIGRRLAGFGPLHDRTQIVVTEIEVLAQPLSGKKRLREWAGVLGSVLAAVYSDQKLSRSDAHSRRVIDSCEEIRETLGELATISESIDRPITAGEAIELVLTALSAVSLGPPRTEQAIEILGWLELHLDDAPVLLITGCNEGALPESIVEDQFLPNTLRTALGLLDNAGRYARDLYALTAILESRPEVFLIAAHHDPQGQVLKLSRLLLAGSAEDTARRVLRIADRSDAPRAQRELPTKSGFVLPPPVIPLAEPIVEMSVSSFSAYLASPYGFYLEHVLGLETLSDRDEELDPLRFGVLLHNVLADFGVSETKNSTDPSEIFRFLDDRLVHVQTNRFGSGVLPSVTIQLDQARERLRIFSEWQARHCAAGWEIMHCEYKLDETKCALTLPDRAAKMAIKGRIDRIDRHRDGRRVTVFDYKTSESADGLKKTYGQKVGWRDLQLPLYLLMLKQLGWGQEIETGYLALSSEEGNIFVPLEIDPERLIEAETAATSVACSVYDGEFAFDLKRAPRGELARLIGDPDLYEDAEEEEEETE